MLHHNYPLSVSAEVYGSRTLSFMYILLTHTIPIVYKTSTIYNVNLSWIYVDQQCSSATNCTECFRLSPSCVWCTQPVSGI